MDPSPFFVCRPGLITSTDVTALLGIHCSMCLVFASTNGVPPSRCASMYNLIYGHNRLLFDSPCAFLCIPIHIHLRTLHEYLTYPQVYMFP
jgi:hypothetical protein